MEHFYRRGLAFAVILCCLLLEVNSQSTLKSVAPLVAEEINMSEYWETEAIRLMQENQESGSVIITSAGVEYKEFVFNWIASLQIHNNTKFLVFCSDELLYEELNKKGLRQNAVIIPRKWVPALWTTSNKSKAMRWGSPEFSVYSKGRAFLQRELLRRNFTILFADADLVFLRPNIQGYLQDLAQYVGRPFIHQSDKGYVNAGFMYLLPEYETLKFFDNYIDELPKYKSKCDQDVLFDFLNAPGGENYLKHMFQLDPTLFQSGFVANTPLGKYSHEPFIVHANYMIGADVKKQWLKNHGYWFAPESLRHISHD